MKPRLVVDGALLEAGDILLRKFGPLPYYELKWALRSRFGVDIQHSERWFRKYLPWKRFMKGWKSVPVSYYDFSTRRTRRKHIRRKSFVLLYPFVRTG